MSNCNIIRSRLQLVLHKFLYEPYDNNLTDNITATITISIQDLLFIDKFSLDYKYDSHYNDLQVKFSYNEKNEKVIKNIVLSIGSG